MTNDAKLGMVAGVAGVIVAAVLLSNAPPPSKPGATAGPGQKDKTAAQPAGGTRTAPTAAVTPAPTESNAVAMPSTPIPRTRKDVDGLPASRPSTMDEEP